jgi:quercetin dioxygenase-like cupin family protein
MKILEVPFAVTDWSSVKSVEHRGEKGTSQWRIFEAGNIRARIVEYSAGYRSDHWCPKGHVLYVVEGEFDIALRDGRNFRLRPGMSFQAGDDESNPHLGSTETGAKVFIVD